MTPEKQTKTKPNRLAELMREKLTKAHEPPTAPTPSPLVNAFQRISYEAKSVTAPAASGLLAALIAKNRAAH